MRTLCFSLLTLLLIACSDAPDTGAAAAFCADLADQNDGCWSDGLDASCIDVYDECGSSVLILESCPVQLACE